MPKYWGKQIFTHRSFPEVGQKQKMEGEKKKKIKKKIIYIFDIPSDYDKILGETNFHATEHLL